MVSISIIQVGQVLVTIQLKQQKCLKQSTEVLCQDKKYFCNMLIVGIHQVIIVVGRAVHTANCHSYKFHLVALPQLLTLKQVTMDQLHPVELKHSTHQRQV